MRGSAVFAIVNPVPVTLTAVTITGSFPVDVNVTDCVAVLLSTTLPKGTLVALTLKPAALLLFTTSPPQPLKNGEKQNAKADKKMPI